MRSLLLYAVLLVLSQRGTGVLTGQLLSIGGAPIAGVRVAAVDASDPTTMASLAQTDREGRYRLENVPAGRYYIVASQRETESYYPGIGIVTEAKVVTVIAGATINALDFKFTTSSGVLRAVRAPSPIPGRFFGTIRDTKGEPLQNMTILVSDPQTNARFMTSTNAAGTFELTGLPVGTFSMEVLSPVQSGYLNGGYEPLTTTIALQRGESLQQDMRLRLVVSSAVQQRPDLYVRPVRPTRGPGAPFRIGSGTGGFRGSSPQAAPLPYPSGVTPAARQEDDDVVLQILVGTDGSVLSLRAMSQKTNPELVRAAVETVSHWGFTPTRTDRGDAEQFGTITVDFVRRD